MARHDITLADMEECLGPREGWGAYFDTRANEPALPLRAKPCPDCAVVWGLYAPISAALATMPFERRVADTERWFCHDTPECACRGNAAWQGREVIDAIKNAN